MTFRKGGRQMEWEGKPDESKLWKLFSDNPDKAAETILFNSELKPLLRKMRLTADFGGTAVNRRDALLLRLSTLSRPRTARGRTPARDSDPTEPAQGCRRHQHEREERRSDPVSRHVASAHGRDFFAEAVGAGETWANSLCPQLPTTHNIWYW